MSEHIDNLYEIGYRKPPKHSRFRKGISGNREGRPKGKRNFVTVLKEILDEKTVIEENGVRRNVTKLEAALIRLVDQATSGDPLSLRLLTMMVRSVEERSVEPPPQVPTQEDLKIIERVLRRQDSHLEGDNK